MFTGKVFFKTACVRVSTHTPALAVFPAAAATNARAHMSSEDSALKAALTAALGSVYEWYDFAAYGYLASDIAAAFFGGRSKRLALLEAFAVYGAAFFTRPLGALLFGRVGDTAGRRGALLGTVSRLRARALGSRAARPSRRRR